MPNHRAGDKPKVHRCEMHPIYKYNTCKTGPNKDKQCAQKADCNPGMPVPKKCESAADCPDNHYCKAHPSGIGTCTPGSSPCESWQTWDDSKKKCVKKQLDLCQKVKCKKGYNCDKSTGKCLVFGAGLGGATLDPFGCDEWAGEVYDTKAQKCHCPAGKVYRSCVFEGKPKSKCLADGEDCDTTGAGNVETPEEKPFTNSNKVPGAQSTPPKPVHYMSWFTPHNDHGGDVGSLVDTEAFPSKPPFNAWNYAIWKVDQKSLAPEEQVFPQGYAGTIGASKFYYHKPGFFKQKGYPEDGPLLSPDTVYYMAMRINNNGIQTWKQHEYVPGSIKPQEAPQIGLIFTKKPGIDAVDSSIRDKCSTTLANSDVSICAKFGGESVLKGATVSTAAGNVLNDPKFGIIKFEDKYIKNTAVAKRLKKLAKTCKALGPNGEISKAEIRSIEEELFKGINVFHFFKSIMTPWRILQQAGGVGAYPYTPPGDSLFKCRDNPAGNMWSGQDYCAGASRFSETLLNIIDSQWFKTSPAGKALTYGPGTWGKIFEGSGAGEGFMAKSVYEFYKRVMTAKTGVSPRCQHKGWSQYGAGSSKKTLPYPLTYSSPATLKVWSAAGKSIGASTQKSPMVVNGKCIAQAGIDQAKFQPDEFDVYGVSALHCQKPAGIKEFYEEKLGTYQASVAETKGGKVGYKEYVYKDVITKWDFVPIKSGKTGYFGFYFKTPPKEKITNLEKSIKDGSELGGQKFQLTFDMAITKVPPQMAALNSPAGKNYSIIPTRFKAFQNKYLHEAGLPKNVPHRMDPITLYVAKGAVNKVKGDGLPVDPEDTKPVDEEDSNVQNQGPKGMNVYNDPSLFSPFWEFHFIDKLQLPANKKFAYFLNDHFYAPAENGFTLSALDTASDKLRKYTNLLWQIAPGGKTGTSPPSIIFNYDYRIREAIMPEGSANSEVWNSPAGKAATKEFAKKPNQQEAWSALEIARGSDLKRVRNNLYKWIRIAKTKSGKAPRFPHLTDTGLRGTVNPATDLDLEEIIQIEGIARRTLPQDLIQQKNDGSALKGAANINCQHPYHNGKYSPRTKCEQAGIVSNHIIQDYKPFGAGCSDKKPCKPGYKCAAKGICAHDSTSVAGKALENFDYQIKMPGICPGYDLENTVIPVPGYRAYDFSYTNLTDDTTTQVRRSVLPGSAQITLKLGDFFDRAVWGNSSRYKDWIPSATWIMPAASYNPAAASDLKKLKDYTAAKIDESIALKNRPTLQLQEAPIVGVLNEVIDSMKSRDWFYDFNFAYKSWRRNTGELGTPLRNKLEYEFDVVNKVNFIGKCVEENLKQLETDAEEIDELALPFAYEPDYNNEKSAAGAGLGSGGSSTDTNQNQFKGRFSGITKKAFIGHGCFGTSYDTSVVSVSPTTLDDLKISLASLNDPLTGFNINNPIYNHVRFDIRNEAAAPKKEDKKDFLFTGKQLNEDEKKQIFNYVVRTDHNNFTLDEPKILVAEYEGTSHYDRPFFYAARQIPINLNSDFTSDIKRGIFDINLKPKLAGIKNKNFDKTLLNDKITKKTTEEKVFIKGQSGPTTVSKGKPKWEFAKGSKLKREWFRDYREISLGRLAKYETIAYKIVKSKRGTKEKKGDTYKQVADQVIYIYPEFKKDTDQSRTINYIDTQIKLGVEYAYDLFAIVLVYGTKYRYGYSTLGKQWKTIDEPIKEESMKNYQEYHLKSKLTPVKAELARSAQRVELGSDVGIKVVDEEGNTSFSSDTKPGTAIHEWYGLYGSGKPGLDHRLKYVSTYSIAGLVDSRPALGIFEIPLLRRPLPK